MNGSTPAQHAEVVVATLLALVAAASVAVLLYLLAQIPGETSGAIGVLGIRAAALVIAGVRTPALITDAWFSRTLLDDDRFDFDSFGACEYCRRNRLHTPKMHADSVSDARAEAMG